MNEQAAQWYRQFGLQGDPFASKEFFFAGGRRLEQLQTLEHLCHFGDLVVLVLGEKGAGKTTLVEQLVARNQDRLPPILVQPDLLAGGKRLLEQIAKALPSISSQPKQGVAGSFGQITEYLRLQAEAGRRALLVIEDAQVLSEEAVELLARHFQPLVAEGQLALVLTASADFAVEWQRRVANPQSFHRLKLAPLTADEVARYVTARFQAAGWNGMPPLSPEALQNLAKQSQGNFAAIHRLAPSLLAVRKAPVLNPSPSVWSKLQWRWLLLVALLLLGSFGLVWLQYQSEDEARVETPPVASSREIIEQPQEPLVLNWPVPEPPPSWAVDDRSPAEPALARPQEMRPPEAAGKAKAREQPDLAREADIPDQPEVAQAPAADAESQTQQLPQAEEPVSVEPVERAGKEAAAPQAETEPQQEAPPTPKPEVASAPPKAKPTPQHPAFRDRPWLMSRPASRYTIQLLGSYNEQTARTMIDETEELQGLWYVKTLRKGQDWFVVLYGEYPDRAAARAAVDGFPAPIKKLQPWVRQFRDVQADAGG